MNIGALRAGVLARLSMSRWPVFAADKDWLNPDENHLWLHSKTWIDREVVDLGIEPLSQVVANTIEQWATIYSTHRLYGLGVTKSFDTELGQISCQLRFAIRH